MITRDVLGNLTLQNPRIKVREPYYHREFYQSPEFLACKHLIYGTASTLITAERRKLIDVKDYPYTDGELARTYLKLIAELQEYKSGMKKYFVPHRHKDRENFSFTVPLYFAGGILTGEWCYVDLNRAHWQIYKPAGYDVQFKPGAGGSLRQGRLHFLDASYIGSERTIYKAVVGHARWRNSGAITAFSYGKPVKAVHNYYLAPGLWGVVAATLQAIAADAVERFGAVYVNNDGYIVPSHLSDSFRDYLASVWSLTSTVKAQGDGTITGCRQYAVGETRTRRTGSGRRTNMLQEIDPFTRRRLLQIRRWPTY